MLTEAEIGVLVDRFGHSARRLMELGWDGAEVTSHGGHLIEQFYDPHVNDRTDRYGGSLENRLRFGREVLAAVRAWTSEDFLVGFRMSAYHGLLEGDGMTDAELVEIAQGMTAGGAVDLLSVSGGTGYTMRSSSVFVPGDELAENLNGPHAGRLRRATGVATLVAGRILDADTAEQALTRDGVDLVAMTRALIADPDLPRTYAAGGTPRPCISLNEGCIGRLYQGRPMWCSVNPGIREPEVDLGAAGQPAPYGRVVVVGGGVAGAEAAFRAAERGSAVVLFERGDRIGGRAELAGRRPGRERWGLYLDWLVARLARPASTSGCGPPRRSTTSWRSSRTRWCSRPGRSRAGRPGWRARRRRSWTPTASSRRRRAPRRRARSRWWSTTRAGSSPRPPPRPSPPRGGPSGSPPA